MIGVLAVGVIIGIAISEALEPKPNNVVTGTMRQSLCDCKWCSEEGKE